MNSDPYALDLTPYFALLLVLAPLWPLSQPAATNPLCTSVSPCLCGSKKVKP
jgi:hypothetical protein